MKYQQSEEGSLTTGYFWTFGATAIPLVSIFLSSLIIARWMGPRVAGLISWTNALATVFLIVGKFGVDGAASKLASEYQVSTPWLIPGLIRRSVLLRLAFTVPAGLCASVFAPQLASFFNEEALIPLFSLSGLLIFAVSFNELAALLILGLKRFRLLFVVRLSMLILRVGLVLAAAVLVLGEVGILGAIIISAFLPGLVVMALLFGIDRGAMPLSGEGSVMKRLFRLSAPLAISGASVTIYSLLDRLMLGYFEGATTVGIYSVARNVVETSLFPTFALIMTLRPALASAFAAHDTKRCSDLVNRSVRSSLFYSAAVVVVFSCLARPLVVGLFSDKFTSSSTLLLLFIPLIVMRSIGAAILPGLIAAEKAGTYARLTLTGAVLNFTLNVLLIPRWGAQGAVVSTLVSYLPIEVLGLWSVSRVIPWLWRAGDFTAALKTAAAAGVAIFAYRRFVDEPDTLLLTLIHAAAITAVFASLLLLTRSVSIEEIKRIVKLLPGFAGKR